MFAAGSVRVGGGNTVKAQRRASTKRVKNTQQKEGSIDEFGSQDSSNYEELVSGADEKKDWKGITLAILCIILIGCLVALSVLILEPDETPLGPALTLKEIIAFSSYFKRNSVFSKSIWRKNSLFFLDSDGNIIRKDFQQPKTIVLAAFNSEFSTENVKDWDVSGDGNFAILKKANDYDAFDLSTSSSQLKSAIANDKSPIFWAEFGSSSGSKIVFKREKGGLVYKESMFGEEVTLSSSQYAAIPPALFLKEVFKDEASLWWSPNENTLAFAEFDMSSVPTRTVSRFLRPNGKPDSDGQNTKNVFYPKSTEKLPKTILKVIDLSSFRNSEDAIILEPTTTSVTYLMSLLWLSDEEFIALWSDPDRELSIYERCFVKQGSCEQVYKSEETSCALPAAALTNLVKISNTKIATLKRGKIAKNGGSVKILLPYSIDVDAKPASAAISAFVHSSFNSSSDYTEGYVDMIGADSSSAVYFRRRLGQSVHLFKQSQTTEAQCLTCPSETSASQRPCDNSEVNCRADMTLCLVKCLYSNETMVPFSYLINNPTEITDWKFSSNNQSFEMVEDNGKFNNQTALKTRKTFATFFGSERTGEKTVSFKLTRPKTQRSERFPIVVFMPSDRSVQSEKRFDFGLKEYFASAYQLNVLEFDGLGSELGSADDYCAGDSMESRSNQVVEFLSKLKDGGFKKSQMIFGLDTKKIALYGFENGANLAISAASKFKTLNCTLAISLLADSSDLASPISSNIKSSSNLTDDIDPNNIRKLKLISPLDDDFISPIDTISLDQKFGIQKNVSLKFLRGTSESLLSSKYWDFYGEYFSSCLKKSSP